MSQQYPIDAIKDRISCYDYAKKYLHLKVSAPGQRCAAAFRGGKNDSSLLINDRDWFDFASNTGGDVIDLCAQARHDGDFFRAVAELADLAGVTVGENSSSQVYREMADLARRFHQALTPTDREYLHSRRIDDATIDKLLIGRGLSHGLQDRITVPYWKAGRPCYLVGRATKAGQEPKYKKLFRSHTDRQTDEKCPIGISDNPIWGIDTLGREGDVILAEGTFDAVSCWQEGFPVLSPMGGRFSAEQLKDLASMLRRRKAVICFDADPARENGKGEAGQKNMAWLAEKLFDAGIVAALVALDPAIGKDISDYYAAGQDLRAVLTSGKDYVSFRIDQLAPDPNRDNELKKLLRAASSFQPFPEVARWIAYAKTLKAWNLAWLSALGQDLRRPLSEDSLVKELRKKHHLLYHEQLGWYEYSRSRGLWQPLADTEIEAYVAAELRHWRTGPRIHSCMRVARSEFIRQDMLNPRRDLLNMRNGMLDLESGKLLPHDPEYYSSIQLGYNYDADADCPHWQDFIASVSAGDERRQEFLQELFGYCLTTDTRYQCAFFLIGEGENGKGVLFKVLTKLVGEANIANVEISSLNEPFQRITLYGKLINMAAETESQVKGTETIFKQIVTGDAITGCNKGKDFISFNPFCKMIFSSQFYPESNDLTHGFMRRLKFLSFPMRYVDEPDPANKFEAQRDRTIAAKLLAELPGIFNWALVGLRALRAQDGFTLTHDQNEMMREYQEISNPLLGFYDDWSYFNSWRARKDVYNDYLLWCSSNKTKPFGPRRFWPAFRRMTIAEEKSVGGDRVVYIVKKERPLT